jgi:hypothetical protein
MSNAVRIATLLSTVMNVTAILVNDPTLQTTSHNDIRSTLLETVDEFDWLGTVAGTIGGLSWPSDAQSRIDRLRAATTAWDPAVAPPQEVLDAARDCFGMIHPIATTP